MTPDAACRPIPTMPAPYARRRLLQFLAASPLLAAGEALAQAARFPDKVISSPKDALNVFDFEAAM